MVHLRYQKRIDNAGRQEHNEGAITSKRRPGEFGRVKTLQEVLNGTTGAASGGVRRAGLQKMPNPSPRIALCIGCAVGFHAP
jgi:hypothetical protein